jgi:hypothetical protein
MVKTATAVEVKAKQGVKPKTTEEPDDDFKKAKRCLDSIGETWYTFDVTVASIYTQGKYDGKYPNFKECAKAEWGMNYVTAMNHVKVGMAIDKFSLSKTALQEFGISWTNFMEISGTLTPDMTKNQVEGRIKKAAEMTHDEVVKFKKEIQHGTADGPKDKFVTLTFKFKNEAADVIINTLNQAKELTGTEFDDAALEYICLDWQNEHDPKNVGKIKKQMVTDLLVDPDAAEEAAAEPAPKKKYKTRADKGKKKVVEDEELVEQEDTDEDELDELNFDTEDAAEDEEEDDDDLLGV